jgi:site-specific DNA-methyltransferase (adenine-specific)
MSGENFQLYHGDCRLILPTLGEVDHTLTDPPYSEATHKGARTAKKQRDGGISSISKLVHFDSLTDCELREVFDLIGAKVDQWLISFIDWRHVLALEQCPPECMEFVRFGMWDKPNGAPQYTGDRPSTGWEAIAILHKAGKRKKWHGGGSRAVWRCNKPNAPLHPTEKPLELVEHLIRLFTDAGDTILDPFMGSGTTGVACMRTGRKFIGIEMDAKYFQIASKRIADAAAQGCLFADTLKPKAIKESGFDF